MKDKEIQLNIQPAFTLSLTIVWSLLEEYSCNHEGVDVSCHALSLGVSQSFQLFLLHLNSKLLKVKYYNQFQ